MKNIKGLILKYNNKEEILRRLNNWKFRTYAGYCVCCQTHIGNVRNRKEIMVEGRSTTVCLRCLRNLYYQESLRMIKEGKKL
jgi:hypothetical protein